MNPQLQRVLALVLGVSLAACSQAGPRPVESGATVEVGFSPDGESLPIILRAIAAARTEILVAAYSFTSKPVSEALVAAAQRGVSVRLVADQKGNKGKYSAANYLANKGLPVRLNGRYKILHHKFMVIDRQHLETGSFNFSKSAYEANAENVIVLRHVPSLATQYAAEWQRLWDEGTDLPANY